ncbi:hypothetical protein MXB_1777 [Myxobolus squamalis]|nr:hypothetical protein MXB_1777 [Myxobolus squamalis]
MSQWAKTEEETKNARCQKCMQKGHWTYECTNPRKYLYRPTRTQILKKKEKLLAKIKEECDETLAYRNVDILAQSDNFMLKEDLDKEKAKSVVKAEKKSSSDSSNTESSPVKEKKVRKQKKPEKRRKQAS